MLEFFWPLIRPFAWLARLLRKIARTLFGQLSWTPPHWLQRGVVRIVLFRRGHPVLVAGIVLLGLLLASGSLWTWRWYQRQPKPHKVYAQVASIPVTPLEKELKFPPLSIEFTESAARLEDLKNMTLQHVRLDPAMPGAWKWTNDRKLAFAPAQDWPADRKFRIIFDKDLFPSPGTSTKKSITCFAASTTAFSRFNKFRSSSWKGSPARARRHPLRNPVNDFGRPAIRISASRTATE